MTGHGLPAGGKGTQAHAGVRDTPSHYWEPHKNTVIYNHKYNHKVYSEDLDYSFCNPHEHGLLDAVSHVLLVALTPLTPPPLPNTLALPSIWLCVSVYVPMGC